MLKLLKNHFSTILSQSILQTPNLLLPNKLFALVCLSPRQLINQISAKWGPDSRFVVEANTKIWWPKSSRSRIVKLMDWGRVTRPWVEYRILGEFLGIRLGLKSNNSAYFFKGSYTNKSRSGKFLWIAKRGGVIRQILQCRTKLLFQCQILIYCFLEYLGLQPNQQTTEHSRDFPSSEPQFPTHLEHQQEMSDRITEPRQHLLHE